MNALLIYPEVPETFWSFRHALKFIRKRAAHPPLGLLTVATLLPDDWNVRLIDANVTPLARADLAWADVALVGGMTLQRDSARAVLARCADAGVRTVAGGPLFSSEPESFPEVDHLVLNEAEITLPRFLHDFLSRGRARRVYRSDDLADMSASPIPRWDLADLSAYASTSVQYSRGCPYDCDFCSVTALFGRAPRTKDAAQIVAELDALWAAGWRERVFFVDDNLIGHRKRLRHELLPALIGWRRRHRGTGFFTQASINLADDPALMRDMVAAGFDTVFIGIETPDDDSLAEC
ncbi:MAG: radical SAM protein, partial [Acidobacteriota bacterium]